MRSFRLKKLAASLFLLLFSIASYSKVKAAEKIGLTDGVPSFLSIEWEAPNPQFPVGIYRDFEGGMLHGLPLYVETHYERVNGKLEIGKVEKIAANDSLAIQALESAKEKMGLAWVPGEPRMITSHGSVQKQVRTTFSFLPFFETDSGWVRVLEYLIRKEYLEQNSNYQNQSKTAAFSTSNPLASGTIYKIGVTSSGIYRVDANLLSSLGASPSTIDIEKVQVFGLGGRTLPEGNWFKFPDTLAELPAHASKASGTFGSSDYLLFYAEGPRYLVRDAIGRLAPGVNRYADTIYYFIKIDGVQPGKRIATSPLLSPTDSTASATVVAFHEQNLENLMKSGRLWIGEKFNDVNRSLSIPFTIPNLRGSDTVSIRVDAAFRAPAGTPLGVSVNGGNWGSITHNENVDLSREDGLFAGRREATYRGPVSGSTVNVSLQWNAAAGYEAWLKHIYLEARRDLVFSSGGQMRFVEPRILGNQKKVQFRLTGTSSNTLAWDVSNPFEPVEYIIDNNRLTVPADSARQMLVFDASSALTPLTFGRQANQNLHGQGATNLVIITAPGLKVAAQKLAEYHIEHDGMAVAVATTQEIYNEFSAGRQDLAALRSYVRIFYNRANSPEEGPQHVLLFGDASFDYRYRSGSNANLVPTFQSEQSLNYYSTYASDLYFGTLDSGESFAFAPLPGVTELLDVAVGRIPVRTYAEACDAVAKIVKYTSPAAHGDWRNNVAFLADDEDGGQHISSSERFINSLVEDYPMSSVEKVYFDLFSQVSAAGGKRYPDVNKTINEGMDRGKLIVNYYGHGGESGLAAERVLSLTDINQWKNEFRMPLFVTATCEFSRYDDPNFTSAGEQVFLKSKGGAIAMMTTSRLTWAGDLDNIAVNNALYANNLFTQRDGEFPTLGWAVATALNRSAIGSTNTRAFVLLGDPAMRLSIPTEKVLVTKINGKAVASTNDTLKALSLVTIEGEITDAQGAMLSDFNGTITPTVFDKPRMLVTRSNDAGSPKRQVSEQLSVIYRGQASVQNGRFSFTFMVPKDISYQFGKGKLSFYASNGVIDAAGYMDSIVVGGSNPNAPADNRGPVVAPFLNDRNFVNGDRTHSTPTLIADLSDESGINTALTGVGHEITIILNDNENSRIILNDYYQATLNSYTRGTVVYPMPELEPGSYTLKLTAWDVHNNSGSATINFEVNNQTKFEISELIAYPNPTNGPVTLRYTHDAPTTEMTPELEVYSMTGQLLRSISDKNATITNECCPKAGATTSSNTSTIQWDGGLAGGNRMAPGMYIYRLKLRAADGAVAERAGKLIVL